MYQIDHSQAVNHLIEVIQELSHARSLESIMAIVRRAARELTGADGATFVLRDGDCCYYADENAISPLWKGQRFPMSACISGWVMNNAQPAVIEDIYQDDRIPADAYRPTFVRSLAMVPIRTHSPVGAIGNYWADHHLACPDQVRLLQALADSTSIAMENVQIYEQLEQRVTERTAQLEQTNRELESFSYSVSHDLRAPLRAIDGFSQALLEDYHDDLDDTGRDYLTRVRKGAQRMGNLIDDLLNLSRVGRAELSIQPVDLGAMVNEILHERQSADPDRRIVSQVTSEATVECDPQLIHIVLENLLENALKYSSTKPESRIEFSQQTQGGEQIFSIRDNGVGFDPAHVGKLFTPFQRLHSEKEFSGTGIGLATVRRIINRHGGRVWAEANPDEGATFYFAFPIVEQALTILRTQPENNHD